MSFYNRTLKSSFNLGFALVFGVALNSCGRHETKMRPIGPDARADLVFFFKTGTTTDQIYAFTNETIGNPTDRGIEQLPGMRETLLVSVDGHKGYAIRFFPEATDAQRKFVRSRIETSPLVLKVFENVAPDDIKALE